MSDSNEDVDVDNNHTHEFVLAESLDITRTDIDLHVSIHQPFYKYVEGARYIRLTSITGRSRGTEKLLRARARKEHTKHVCNRAAKKLVGDLRNARDATFRAMVRER